MPKWAPFLSLVASLGVGAILSYSSGCAGSSHRHEGVAPGDDSGLGGDDGGMTTITAPGPIGVALFTAPCASGGPAVDWSPMRRVSRVEYDNMVRDLLGDTTQPATAFAPESPMTNGVNFLNNTYAGVSELIAQQYLQAAETLAYTAVSNTTTFSGLLTSNGCTTQDDTCAKAFIAAFANRAFRGQLDDTESMGLLNLYSTVKGQFDFPTGIQAIIEAVLESPRFLYVVELGNGMPSGKVVALSQYEIAGRLSLFLWRSVPDSALMTAAAANQLSTPAQIQTQAGRMIADAKATGALNDFTTQWAQLQNTANEGKDTQFSSCGTPTRRSARRWSTRR
jgi:hypothetical protein